MATMTQQVTTPVQTPAPVVAPVTPQTTAQIATTVPADILKRVSQTQVAKEKVDDSPKVSVDMADIKDPVAKQILEKRLAEANLAISKTFGEVGADKAKLMKQVEELNSRLNQPWTPQRVQQELLQRQDFIQSAQQLQAQAAPQGWQGSSEEWSNLNETEKRQFQNMLASQQTLNQQMNQLLQSQVDSQLKTTYPDYDAAQVDNFYRESYAGQVPPDRIREMIYKAINYDTHVKRAYDFAMADKTSLNQERVNGMTPQTSPTTGIPTDKVERLPNEPVKSWMSRVITNNMEKVKSYRQGQRQ